MARLTMLLAAVTTALACGGTPTSPSSTLSSNPTPVPAPVPTPPPVIPSDLNGVGPDNLIRLSAPPRPADSGSNSIVGRYTLEIVSRASSGLRCEAMPEHAKRRTYTADIDAFRDYYAVRLYDAIFLKDSSRVLYGCTDTRLETAGVCHQFILRRDGNERVTIEMAPEDEYRGAEIWEALLPETRLLQLAGRADGMILGSSIAATGAGGVWYGNGLPASDYSGCNGEMSWTFRRQ